MEWLTEVGIKPLLLAEPSHGLRESADPPPALYVTLYEDEKSPNPRLFDSTGNHYIGLHRL